jgi:hypothetical protein
VADGEGAEARRLYERSFEIRKRLADREPDNTSYPYDLSVSLERLGDLARVVGDGPEAPRPFPTHARDP